LVTFAWTSIPGPTGIDQYVVPLVVVEDAYVVGVVPRSRPDKANQVTPSVDPSHVTVVPPEHPAQDTFSVMAPPTTAWVEAPASLLVTLDNRLND
jgi:hypothetical protein